MIDSEPRYAEVSSEASPEYWLGWVLSYAQWYFNKSYSALIEALPCSKLIKHYFPYHEMDIMHSMDLIGSHLDLTPPTEEDPQDERLEPGGPLTPEWSATEDDQGL